MTNTHVYEFEIVTKDIIGRIIRYDFYKNKGVYNTALLRLKYV